MTILETLRSSYQERRVGIPVTSLTLPHFCACFKSILGFPSFCRGSICVQWVKMRDDYSFYWYWWKWWPSQFKLSFHKRLCAIAISESDIVSYILYYIYYCFRYSNWYELCSTSYQLVFKLTWTECSCELLYCDLNLGKSHNPPPRHPWQPTTFALPSVAFYQLPPL